jgi:glyoxylase-like metal-dependent hydrolase (beta-lactamase superfamily II)
MMLEIKTITVLAMHPHDFGMIEHGDMFWNRQKGNSILKAVAPLLFRFDKSNRVTPDVTLHDGDDLVEYGLDAKVLSLLGHSRGSIGLLTSDGDLFVGDLLDNVKQPTLNAIMDDRAAAQASVGKLKRLKIKTVYPGHGAPFLFDRLSQSA